jgi:hypothetical protein
VKADDRPRLLAIQHVPWETPHRILDPGDSILGALAPSTTVLHWHGEVFDLPDGAKPLARSAKTEHQAFRHAHALPAEAEAAEPELIERTEPGLKAFAALATEAGQTGHHARLGR